MISKTELQTLAVARLEDAKTLCEANRFDGSVYICGYVVELGLKHRICKTLNWEGFPSSAAEFRDYRSFKTHNLDVLLNLAGIENKIKSDQFTEWSAVTNWDPAIRYIPIGTTSKEDAEFMVKAAEKLLRKL